METCIEDTDPLRSGQKLLLRDAAADGRIFPELAEDLSINKRTSETRTGTARYRSGFRTSESTKAHESPKCWRSHRAFRLAQIGRICGGISDPVRNRFTMVPTTTA